MEPAPEQHLLQRDLPSASQSDTPASLWEEASCLCQQRRLKPALLGERSHLRRQDETHLGRRRVSKDGGADKVMQGFG